MSRLAIASLLPLLSSACVLSLNSNEIVVDGVELREKHAETIEIPAWDASGLTLRSWGGDIHIESTSGPNQITATVHEETPGDASIVYEGGQLLAFTKSGAPYAIGDVQIFSNGALPALDVETGMGDVLVHGVDVQGKVELETGMGDIELLDSGTPESIEASSGMGGIEIRGSTCRLLTAASGLGDVVITNVTAVEARLESGLGDVSVTSSQLDSVTAETGLGDIDCHGSEIGQHEFDTGLGSVRTR